MKATRSAASSMARSAVISLLALAAPCNGLLFNPIKIGSTRYAPQSQIRSPSPRLSSIELPLFDPRGDELAFPFAAPKPTNALDDDAAGTTTVSRYAFDRPVYLRLFKDLKEKRESSGEAMVGHCVKAGAGEAGGLLAADSMARTGTIGVVLNIAGVEVQPKGFGAPLADDPFGDEVAIVTASAAFRFVVEEVVSTFPYPTGKVTPLRDAAVENEAETAKLETELQEALTRLVEISEKLEQRGPAAEEAAEALSAPRALLEAHEQAVMGGLYTSTIERYEALSLGACNLVAMPYRAAVECVATTSAAVRFTLLLEQLRPAIQEMSTLLSLESLGGGDDMGGGGGGLQPGGDPFGGMLGTRNPNSGFDSGFSGAAGSNTGAATGADARASPLGGTTSFTPVDIPLGPAPGQSTGGGGGGGVDLPEGARIEFWYNEDYGWIKATVLAQKGGSVHTLRFDIDGEVEDIAIERWQYRPLRGDGI